MFSIIVCSVNHARLDALKKNIRETAGSTPYEVIAYDNSREQHPIAWVYNKCASEARYPNLLFIHEDAGFKKQGWMEEIASQLNEPDCGVIGFAGSILMVNAPGGWNVMPQWCIINVEECGDKNHLNVNPDVPFVEVVDVDGFAMFVRKEVWKKHPFDESVLTGFHCYDVDFSLAIGQEYKNYVCCDIETFHNSRGNFGKDWATATLKIYKEKWNKILPRYVEGEQLTPRRERNIEERVTFRFLKTARRHGLPVPEIKSRFLKFPLNWRHFEHLVKYYVLRAK